MSNLLHQTEFCFAFRCPGGGEDHQVEDRESMGGLGGNFEEESSGGRRPVSFLPRQATQVDTRLVSR